MSGSLRRAAALLAVLLLVVPAVLAAAPAPARGERGMVVAPEPVAARIGLEKTAF